MTKQLTLIRDLVLRMSSIWVEINVDALVDVREFAEFVFLRIRNAKVYSVDDVKAVCELYRDWHNEVSDIVSCLEDHKLLTATLGKMHTLAGEFDWEGYIEQADAIIENSEQFIAKFYDKQPTL